MSIVCPNCSTQAEAGAIFCDNCGYDLRSVQQAPPPPAPAYTPPTPAGGGVKCPSCGYDNVAGAAFCENCGFSLATAQPPVGGGIVAPPPSGGGMPGVPITPPPSPAAAFMTGRLVIQAANTSLQFPPGKTEIIIGREDPVSGIFPEVDLDPHGGQDSGVSRQHCKLVSVGGQVYAEAFDTPNGSFLNKQKLMPGQRMPIKAGDELRLGKMALLYYDS